MIDPVEVMARAMLESDGVEGYKVETLDAYKIAARAALTAASEAGWVLVKREDADRIVALQEELDLLRARVPRAYIMTRQSEWLRMFREASAYLNTCRRQHHGTDLEGRRHLVNALDAAMKELGESEQERRVRVLAELDADAAMLSAASEEAARAEPKDTTKAASE